MGRNPIDFIPYGHDHPITRQTLSVLCGLSDRKVREHIEAAVRSGQIIVNLDNGYFRYKDAADLPYIKAYYRREMARGWADINKCRTIRRFLEEHKDRKEVPENQLSLFDLGLN